MRVIKKVAHILATFLNIPLNIHCYTYNKHLEKRFVKVFAVSQLTITRVAHLAQSAAPQI